LTGLDGTSPPLDLMEPRGDPVDAGPCLRGRHHRHRTHPATIPTDWIRLTCNEIRHLFTVIIAPIRDITHWLRCSAWRRQHQHRAQRCHYQQRLNRDDPDREITDPTGHHELRL
jgi:hypothetical protein